MRRNLNLGLLIVTVIVSGAGYLVGSAVSQEAAAAASLRTENVGAAAPRENYFPNTESLAADEMRVIALGTESIREGGEEASTLTLYRRHRLETDLAVHILSPAGSTSSSCSSDNLCEQQSRPAYGAGDLLPSRRN